ncbi:MAG: hypothetical protein ACR2GT_01760 [Gaiellaceae bacterium]
MSAGVLARLDRIETELRDLGGELQAIRGTVLAGLPQPPVAVEPQPLRRRAARAAPFDEPRAGAGAERVGT